MLGGGGESKIAAFWRFGAPMRDGRGMMGIERWRAWRWRFRDGEGCRCL